MPKLVQIRLHDGDLHDGDLHDGDLHAVGWGEGPWAMVTPVKAIRVEVGL